MSHINGGCTLFTGKYHLTPRRTGFPRKKPEPFAFFGTRGRRTHEQSLFINPVVYSCLQPISILGERAGHAPSRRIEESQNDVGS